MITWIYLQAFVDVALSLGIILLFADRHRRRTADAWRSEVAGLVDTLGELLVEVERVTSGPVPVPEAAEAPAPADERVTAPPAVAMAVPEPTFRPAPEPAPTPPVASEGVDAVLAFARQGLGADDIARRVGRPVGEVALVLGLRGPRAAGVGA